MEEDKIETYESEDKGVDIKDVAKQIVSRFKQGKGIISDKPISKLRIIIGTIFLLISAMLVSYIIFNYDTLTEQKIIYPDGCEEIYQQANFWEDQVLITPECTLGREMVKSNNQIPTLKEYKLNFE